MNQLPLWIKRLYGWAGAYGVVALIPNYFMETRFGVDHPPAITHPEFYYGFTGVGLAWQVAFFIIAKDPIRYRAIMVPAMLEKVTFALAVAWLLTQSRVPSLYVGAAAADLLLASAFLAAFLKTPSNERPV